MSKVIANLGRSFLRFKMGQHLLPQNYPQVVLAYSLSISFPFLLLLSFCALRNFAKFKVKTMRTAFAMRQFWLLVGECVKERERERVRARGHFSRASRNLYTDCRGIFLCRNYNFATSFSSFFCGICNKVANTNSSWKPCGKLNARD